MTIAFTDGTIRPWEEKEAQRIFWHSSAHLMAEALEALYPGIKFGVGPAVETGFYYDVDLGDRQISESDLKAIEDKMIELARTKEQFVRTDVSKEEALKNFTEKGDQYKCELIKDLEDGTITFYQNGNFTDLCRGPHLKDTSVIKAVKLLSIAGAYWRGDEKRNMLTRIYGVTFPKKTLLDEHLALLEEAKKRDHRKIGKEMELFTFSHKVGMGLPLWLPKGADLRYRLEVFLRKLHAARPDVPILLCEGIEPAGTRLKVNAAIKEIYDRQMAEGSRLAARLHYLPATGLIPTDGESTHDYVHPNDYGSVHMGKAFARAISEILQDVSERKK